MRATSWALAFCAMALVSSPVAAEDVLFQDDFKDGLSEKWQVVGLEETDYRVRDGGLEMRVQPGKFRRGMPMLKVVLPFTTAETVVASVKVTTLDKFTVDGEFAGVCLVDESGPEFAVKKQRVDGKLVFAPGEYEFKGKPGEEGDPARYDVKYQAAEKEAGALRIISDRGYAYFQVGPSVDGKYLNFFHSALRKEKKERGFCLITAGGPEGEEQEHWVRFEEFRVVRR